MTDSTGSVVVATRPTPGHPRPYHFPAFERSTLPNGLDVLTAHLPGRPLISAQLVYRNGAADEPPAEAGATVLSSRALTEGTERYDAIELVEATERLGASLHADASWDAYTVGIEVPASRLEPAFEILAEVVAHPTFPEEEVERIRDERLNDILQARADARRRADEAFAATIYRGTSPYHRPSGGTRSTVSALGRETLQRAWERGLDPATSALVVAGDLEGIDLVAVAGQLLGGWTRAAGAVEPGPIDARPTPGARRIRLVDKPGAPQSEIRVGHVGLSRRIPDFHAVSVLGAILGGLFNSRLNMKLREEKGYTYGAHATYDLRRAAGPFAARAAVNTEVTAAALSDLVAELDRIRSSSVTDAELRAARDYLIGVFPIRFETPGPIVQALTGLLIHNLPDDELATYRERIDAVTADDVLAAARAHLHPDQAAAVVVGDASVVRSSLEEVGFGPVEVTREDDDLAEI